MSFIREFLTRWDFDVNDQPLENMEKKLSLAAGRMRNLDKATEEFNKKAEALGKIVAGVGAALTASVAGLFLVTKSTAQYAATVNDTAIALGVTTDQLQKLRYAAAVGGASVDKLETALRMLAKNSVAATDGTGEQAEAFQILGIAVRNSSGEMREVNELLLDAADAFSALQEGPAKTALAMKVFGKEGASLLPFLNRGRAGIEALLSEAEDLGLVITREVLEAFGQFNDSLNRIDFILTMVKVKIGASLLPAFQGMVNSILDWVKANRELIKTKVEEWAEKISSALSIVWRVTAFGFKIVDRIVQLFGGWEFAAKAVLSALALFGAAKILIALNAAKNAFGVFLATKTIASLTKLRTAILWIHLEIQTLTVKTLAAQAAALAIPLAIAAAVAAIGLLIEDVVTFFEGGESAFGKFLRMIQDNLDWMERAFIDVGTSIIEFWIWPLRTVYETLNKIFKMVTGIDALGMIGIKTGEAGEKQRAELLKAGLGGAFRFATSPIRDANIDERGILREGPIKATPAPVQPLPAARRASDSTAAANARSSGPTTLTNNVTVNASGMTQDQAKAVFTEAIKRSTEDLHRRAGQKSQPKIRE